MASSRGNVPLWFRQDADLRFYDIDDSLFLTQLLAPCTDLRFQFPDALICRLLWMACPQLSPGDFLPTAQSVSANPQVPDDLCSLRPLLCHRFTEPALNTSSYQGDASPFRPYAVSFCQLCHMLDSMHSGCIPSGEYRVLASFYHTGSMHCSCLLYMFKFIL